MFTLCYNGSRGLRMSVNDIQYDKLLELVNDIRDRTTRIETKTDRLKYIEKKLDDADDKANEALLKAKSNEKEIDKTQSNIRWTWGIISVLFTSILGVFAKIFL